MIAVTGSTGFLGASLVRALLKEKFKVRCLIRPRSPRASTVLSLPCETAETNFDSRESIAASLEGCETVIHVMGLINGTEEILRKVNINYTHNLLEACKEKKIRKFIFISSVAALRRHGPYGESKFQAEELVRHAGIPYLIFRPAYIFGAEDRNNTRMMIHTLKVSPVVPLLGGGTFKLQPVYVEDVVRLIIQGIHFSRMNCAYTVAGNSQISLRAMLDTLAMHLKVKRLFLPVPLKPLQAVLRIYLKIFPATRLPAKQILELDKHEAFDISETRRDFNFNPASFEEGAARMFEPVCAE